LMSSSRRVFLAFSLGLETSIAAKLSLTSSILGVETLRVVEELDS
jgi:hypothetical protein